MSTVQKAWPAVLKNLHDEYIQLHVPIGLDTADSLPIHKMMEERTMLRDLGEIVREKKLRIIFENQDGPIGVKNWKQEINRLRTIGAALTDISLIAETYFS